MQISWIMTREDSRVDEAAKRPFSHGDAETGKTASTGDANKWKLELVSVECFCTSVSSHLRSLFTFALRP